MADRNASGRMPMPKAAGWSILLVVFVYILYAGAMINSSSVVVAGQRWFSLLDDAMISMRYARNLSDGLGLVWNSGERVEGITNPGWTSIMALVHLVESNRNVTALYMQIISGLCLATTIWIVAQLAWRLTESRLASIATAAITAFYYPLNYFSLFGMETGVLALCITSAIALWYRQWEKQKFPWQTYLILGMTTLIRLDAVVPLLVVSGYGVLVSPTHRYRLYHFSWLCIMLGVFVGGQTLARYLYYGEPVPNTYYLKMTGFPILQRMARGAWVTGHTLWILLLPMLIVWTTAFVIGAGRALWRKHKGVKSHLINLSSQSTYTNLFRRTLHHRLTLVTLVFSGQVAYSVYVGGDAWEDTIYCNRYIVVSFPLFALVSSYAIMRGCQLLSRQVQVPAMSGLFAASVLSAGFLFQTLGSVLPSFRSSVLLLEPQSIQETNRNLIGLANFVRKHPDWVVSCDWAGTIPYFIDNYVVDPLGKCDPHIAKMEAVHLASPTWYKAFYPGHMKWDPEYTYNTYKPDLLIFLWGAGSGMDFKPILNQYYDQIDTPRGMGAVFKLKSSDDLKNSPILF